METQNDNNNVEFINDCLYIIYNKYDETDAYDSK